jgi:hypothetical protein
VNEEASFADEVIVIQIDGEVVDGFLAWERGDRHHPAPGALHRLYKVANLHPIRFEPNPIRGIAALDPEGMVDAGPQRRSLALDAHLQQRGLVQRSERRDRPRLHLAGRAAVRENLVAHLDLLDGNVAAAGMDRRADGSSQGQKSVSP